MEWFSAIDWGSIFLPDTPLLEIFVRGSAIYLALFFMLRLILKRQMGALGTTDLLVIVLIADASQNAMAADYNSLPDGLALVATLIFWNCTLEWLGYRYEWVERILNAPPLPLVKNGRMIKPHMRRELITEDELMAQLRLQGIDKISKVKSACLEGDGKISVIEMRPRKNRRSKPLETPV